MWCIHIAVRVVCQNYVNNKKITCYIRAVLVHLVRPSILVQNVGQIFSLRHASLSLKLVGNADCQLHGSAPKPSVKMAINSLSVMWPNNMAVVKIFCCEIRSELQV